MIESHSMKDIIQLAKQLSCYPDIKKAYNRNGNCFDAFWQITLKLNDSCSLHCKHCRQFVSDNNSTHLPFPALLRLIDNCEKRNATKSFLLTGGEPLFHPEFASLMDRLKDSSIPFDINTTLDCETAAAHILLSANPRTIKISLHSMDDTCILSGIKGKSTLLRIMKNARLILHECASTTAVHVNMVVTPSNLCTLLDRIARVFTELQPHDICLMPLYGNDTSPFLVDHITLYRDHILPRICDQYGDKYPHLRIRALFLLTSIECFVKEQRAASSANQCHAGSSSIFVDNLGKIYPCLVHQIYRAEEESICLGTLSEFGYFADGHSLLSHFTPYSERGKPHLCQKYCPIFFSLVNDIIASL